MITKTKSKSIFSGLRITVTLSLILVFFLILSCEPSKTQSIKMTFIQQGQFNSTTNIGSDTFHNATISVEAFYMSNEITNKEYREFTDWAKKNPDETIYQAKYVQSVVSDNKTGSMKDTMILIPTPIKISEILHDPVDLIAQYKLDNKYLDYFTDNKYDNYPVVGVSRIQAEYFCIWKSNSKNITRKEHGGILELGMPYNYSYRLPLEMEWEYVAQQPFNKKSANKNNNVFQKVNEGDNNKWGLFHLMIMFQNGLPHQKRVMGL